jgi:hypothetical protein
MDHVDWFLMWTERGFLFMELDQHVQQQSTAHRTTLWRSQDCTEAPPSSMLNKQLIPFFLHTVITCNVDVCRSVIVGRWRYHTYRQSVSFLTSVHSAETWMRVCGFFFFVSASPPTHGHYSFHCRASAFGWSPKHLIYILLSIHSSMAVQPFVEPWPLLQFRNRFYKDGKTPWMSDQPVARPLPTHRTTQTQNKRTHRHPCFQLDSNPRSQLSSGRRQFTP